MMRYLPLVLAVVAIAGAATMDLFSNAGLTGKSEAWAVTLEQGVPQELGPWKGIDMPTNEEDDIVAGAVGKVSRRYVNSDTGNVVDLWLIVGPRQAITRHTPNVCYKAAGFSQQEQLNRYQFEVEGQPPAEFWTSWFERSDPTEGRQRRRVFWAWTLPEKDKPITWKAPLDARYAYAGASALFKMYFTTAEPDEESTLAANPANDLADRIIPLVADLLEKGADAAQEAANTAPSSEDSVTPEGAA